MDRNTPAMTRPPGENGGLCGTHSAWQLALVKTDRNICSVTDQQQTGNYQGHQTDLGRKELEARGSNRSNSMV